MFSRKNKQVGFAASGDDRIDGSYDIVIIGSGAGGATIAQRLAPTGKSILILERGDRLPVEPSNWNAYDVFVKHRYRTNEQWRDRKNRRFHPTTHYWVGGNTSFYGSALFRFRKNDFEEVQHGDGISPRWPISYTDLKPYYYEAEKLWNVHGTRGEDPTDDADAPPYPRPAIDHDPDIAELKRDLTQGGWNPFDLPLGIDRENDEPWKGNCVRCTTCGGFPCLTRAKSDGRAVIEQVETFDNVTVQTQSKVVRLETDRTGKSVSGVVYEREGSLERVKGDVVILAAGAANSAAILLKSAGAGHETGLANSSDQVGRNYMFHTLSAVLSTTGGVVDATFPKTFAINDFYWNDPEGGYDLPMGHVQLLEYMNADTIRGQLSAYLPPVLFPKAFANILAKRLLAFMVITEDLPLQKNRVKVNKDGEIVLDYWYNNLKGHERLVKKFQDKLTSVG
ncbi:MAG: GMC family oxidoreductase, partial [Pseudomonadota bacterium]